MYPFVSLKSFARFLILLLIVQLSIGFFVFPVNHAKAAGRIYYVDSVSGNNTNDGLSTSTAWQTIAKVNGLACSGGIGQLNAGDSVLFMRGDTWREQLTVPCSGTSGSPITFGAYGSGARPIINGSDLVTGWTSNAGNTENEGNSTDLPSNFAPTNFLFFVQVTTTNGGTLQNYLVHFGSTDSSLPNHVKAALYSDSSNYPGALLANSQSAGVVPVAGWNSLPVTGGMTLAPSTKYWIAWWIDKFTSNAPIDETNNVLPAYSLTTTYGSWPANGNGATSWSNGGAAFYAVVGTGGTPNTWAATVTDQPLTVWFNGNLGTPESSVASLASPGEWYWSTSTLYVYSTSSPSTAYTNPGIESADRDLVSMTDKSNIILDNITFNKGGNMPSDNSIFLRQSQSITLQNCDVTDSVGMGIDIANVDGTTGDTLIQYCTFRGTGEAESQSGAAPSGIQTYNTDASSTLTVQYSTFQDMDAWGIHHGHGIYDQSGNLIWRYNYHYGDRGTTQSGAGAGAAVRLASPGWSEVYGNVFSNNGGRRYWGILPDPHIAGAPGTNYIYNNTFINNDYGIFDGGENNFVENNIFYGTPSNEWYYVDTTTSTSGVYSGNNNIFYGASNGWVWNNGSDITTLGSWQSNSGQDSHSIQSDPLFISTSTNNFALQASSPAIDAGVNLGSTYEYGIDPASTWPGSVILDNENNYGAGWEIGAYVYTQTSPPSVAIIAPSNLATVSSAVTLSASSTAVAPASISSVQFYLDGSPLGSAVTSSPYAISWNTATTTNASHTLYALATDNYSNTATSTSITVTVANQAVLSVPTSTLSFSAVHGSTATSTQSVVVKNAGATSTTLNWSASSTQTWLTFSLTSGSLAGNATTSISFIVNPATLALGTYNATATISDPAASSSPQTIPVTLTISSTGVSATMTAPANLATVSNTVPVMANATSTVGISSVRFYLDESPLGSTVTSSPYTISWNTLTASDGSHTLYSQATDNNSNIASSSEITITVDNTPPAVSIISPMSGATVSGTTSITASSSDALSGVSSVAFYLDGSLLGESTSSPYSINWDTTQTSNGSHSITARSTDGAGNATTSQAISVTVHNAPSVSSGGGGGGVPQSAFIIVPVTTSTASSTTSASSTASSSLPLVVPTSTAPSAAITTSSLQAELNTLLAELQSLEAQAGNATTITNASSSSSLFTTDLQLWDEGPEVTALQSYLIQQDKGPAAEKLKAHGTTNVFGFLTYNALVEFQASVGIHATGYFGPITRAWVNGHE